MVEDDAGVACMLANCLQAHGFVPHVVSGGALAVAAVHGIVSAAIFSNVVLPTSVASKSVLLRAESLTCPGHVFSMQRPIPRMQAQTAPLTVTSKVCDASRPGPVRTPRRSSRSMGWVVESSFDLPDTDTGVLSR